MDMSAERVLLDSCWLQLLDVHSCNMSMWKLGSRPIICINVDCSSAALNVETPCCGSHSCQMAVWAFSPIQSSLSSSSCNSGPSGPLSAPQHGSASFCSHPQLPSHFSSPLTFVLSSPLQLHPLLSYNSSPFLWVIPLAQSVICHYPSTLPPVFFSILCFGIADRSTKGGYLWNLSLCFPLIHYFSFPPSFFSLPFCVCRYQLVLQQPIDRAFLRLWPSDALFDVILFNWNDDAV